MDITMMELIFDTVPDAARVCQLYFALQRSFKCQTRDEQRLGVR